MSIGSFETENQNTLQQNQQYFLDFDGSLKFTTPYISSPNFNGDIPTVFDTISASLVIPGMYLSLSGATGDAYYLVTSRSFDDPDFTNASRDYTIRYLDSYGVTQEITYDADDSVYVKYEDWDEKDLGTVGWAITSGGNAIFTNVAVRGRIEAEEGYISESLTIGSGGSITFNDVATSDDVQELIDDLNEAISASISDIYLDIDSFSSSLVFLYEAGFVSSAQLITTGATQITGNNITTGIINANLVRVTSASSLVQNRGVQFSAVGIEGYNNTGNRTFFLNTDGSLIIGSGADIAGYATDGELSTASNTLNNIISTVNDSISASISDLSVNIDSFSSSLVFLYNAGFVSSAQLITTGATTITGNNITTGIINANLVRVTSASSLVQNRGVQLSAVGLEGYNNLGQRTFFLNTDGTLEITGYATDNELQTASGILNTGLNNRIVSGGAAADITTNSTTITGGNISTGRIRSSGYNGPVSGGGLFSTVGSQFNLDDGTIVAPNFRIDSSGNAFFSGSVTGSTIIGSVLKSSATGQRIEISSSQIETYGPSGFFEGGIYATDAALVVGGNPNVSLFAPGGQIGLSTSLVAVDYYIQGNPGLLYGNGSGLTNINPSNISAGTAGINITGNASNITSYTINQNVHTGSSPTFFRITALTNQTAGQGTHYLHWNSTGGTVTRSTSLPTGSSRTLKDNINSFSVDPDWTNSINNIYTFQYKSDIEDFGVKAPTQLGILVDEISNIPEIGPLIFEVNSASALDYTKIGILLIPVINNLKETVINQQKTIEDLQDRVLQLESQIGG